MTQRQQIVFSTDGLRRTQVSTARHLNADQKFSSFVEQSMSPYTTFSSAIAKMARRNALEVDSASRQIDKIKKYRYDRYGMAVVIPIALGSASGESSGGSPARRTPASGWYRTVECPASPDGQRVHAQCVYTLPDIPTDGSGKATNNPALIQVFIGSNPTAAFENGAVLVASLSACPGCHPLLGAGLFALYTDSNHAPAPGAIRSG